MKSTILLLLALAASTGQLLAADSAIPKAYERERYEPTTLESPFALATPVVEGEKPVDIPNILTDLYVTGVTQQNGKDCVLVRAPGDERSIMLEIDVPYNQGDSPYNGVTLKKVNWSDRYSAVSVTLQHGTTVREGVQLKRDTAAAVKNPAGTRQTFRMPNFPGAQPMNKTNLGGSGALIPPKLDTSKQSGPKPSSGGPSQNLKPLVPKKSVSLPGGRAQGSGGGNSGAPNTGPVRVRDRVDALR